MTTNEIPRHLMADIVVRVSQALVEKDRDTLERQEADGRAYCDRKGLTVNSVIQEVISGYHVPIRKRKGFMRAFRNVEVGRTGHIVIARGDRWTREGAKVALTVQGEITDMGGKLHLLDIGEGEIDLSGEMAEGVFGILADTWKLESMRISKRVKRAVDQQIRQGDRHGGVRPYGVHRAPMAGPKPCPSCGSEMGQHEVRGTMVAKIEPCPVEVERIQRMAEMKIAGTPIWQIIRFANDQGWPTASGKPEAIWRPQTLTGILSSASMRGERTNVRGGSKPDAWAPVIPIEQHDALLSAMRTRKNTTKRKQTLLGGLKLLKCGRCGYYLGSRLYTGRGGKPRYACPTHPNSGKPGGSCQACSAIQEHVDNRVIDLLAKHIGRYVEATSQSGVARDLDHLIQQRDEAQESLNDLMRDWYTPEGKRRLTKEQYDSLYDRITSRIEDLVHQIDRQDALQASSGMTLPSVGEDPKTWFLAQPLDTQRFILTNLLVSITLAPVGTKAGSAFRPERVTIQPKFATALAMMDSDQVTAFDEKAVAEESYQQLVEEAGFGSISPG